MSVFPFVMHTLIDGVFVPVCLDSGSSSSWFARGADTPFVSVNRSYSRPVSIAVVTPYGPFTTTLSFAGRTVPIADAPCPIALRSDWIALYREHFYSWTSSRSSSF
ncbi:hypothetical protein HGRIS_003113 [Hohenbuehelia grisea]|uniref:Uncharacterized protein n=1 Tax=Hohenbuehelia grisea TaxID=104357 RepID=A0ABR3JMR1_9AGAR